MNGTLSVSRYVVITRKTTERRDDPLKLTTTAQVSVDGVMQGPGGPEEDERGVFERGGWAHFDNEAGAVMDEIYQRADAFLVRPAHLRDLRRLLGNVGRSGRQPDLDGVGHAAQVRGIDHAHQAALGEHDRPRR